MLRASQATAAARTRWYSGSSAVACAIFVLTFVIYNANGREISSWDSQPTKYAAIELANYHTLTLDRVVMVTPALAARYGFATDLQGHVRSGYPVLPSIVAGGVALLLHQTGRAVAAAHLGDGFDLTAPAAATLVAKLTASLLTAFAAALAFVVARRRLTSALALAVAIGFGLGTNLWAQASQTLWQTETVVAALCGAAACLAAPAAQLTTRRLWFASLCLGLAGAARPQIAPVVAVLSLSIVVRRRRWPDMFAILPGVAVAAITVYANARWFGDPLGAVYRLEQMHGQLHGVVGSLGSPLTGAFGLLFSPSRGLLVFSPVVLVALGGTGALLREGWDGDLRWWGIAAVVQFAVYASYSVWWGGHTYGPRYCLDILPLLVPIAAAGLPWFAERPWRATLAAAALAWSILLAATGAFVYPFEQWNNVPVGVDLNHDRLWDWRDAQFVRCWHAGWSPSNFKLLTIDAVRRRAVPIVDTGRESRSRD